MKVYCGNYMNDVRPTRVPWKRAVLIAVCLLFTSAATPAMIAYYWNGQNSRENLAFEEAIRLAQDESMPVHSRKSAQLRAYVKAKVAIQAIQNSQGAQGLSTNSDLLLGKLTKIIEERR